MNEISTPKIKSFWQRREGKTGMLLVAGLAGAALYGAYLLLPILAIIAWNAVSLGIAATALFLLSQILLNGRIQAIGWYLIQLISRGLTSILYAVDPEGILEEYVKDRQRKHQKAEEATQQLRGTIKQLEETIDRNKETILELLARARAATQRLQSGQLLEEEQSQYSKASRLAAAEAGLQTKTNETFGKLLDQLRHYHRIMVRLNDAAEFVIRVTKMQVEQIIIRRRGVEAAYGAMKAVRAIIKGDAKTEIYDETVERLIADADQKLGEIDGFAESIAGFLTQIDLERGTVEESAWAQIDEMGKKVDAIIMSTDNARGVSTGMPVQTQHDQQTQQNLTHGSAGSSGLRSIADLIDEKRRQ